MCIRDRNMPAYEHRPKEHQAKVARGELEKGMSPMAVLLALVEPEQKMAGMMNGKNTERWIYTRSGTCLLYTSQPNPCDGFVPHRGTLR